MYNTADSDLLDTKSITFKLDSKQQIPAKPKFVSLLRLIVW